tara:strand:+ start:624 stop:1013 length:390 start_codon:yes stop_codon:yes gene_type:complete
MKNLKFLTLAMFILSSVTFFAQDKKSKTPEQKAQNLTEKMQSDLSLSAEQTDQISIINLGIAQKNHSVKMNKTMSAEDKKIARKENQKARTQMYKEVLTVSQFETMKKLKKQRRASRKPAKEIIKEKAE